MMVRRRRSGGSLMSLRNMALLAAISLAIDACGASPATSSGSPTPLAGRPSSPAVVRIVRPTSGATVSGPTVHVVLSLQGARIVTTTTTNIRLDEGHLHLYVDNALVSMNYGLEQDIALQPGTYVVKAEFVAADHAPFNPRVWSAEVVFTVK
jgi:hypothetical protein